MSFSQEKGLSGRGDADSLLFPVVRNVLPEEHNLIGLDQPSTR